MINILPFHLGLLGVDSGTVRKEENEMCNRRKMPNTNPNNQGQSLLTLKPQISLQPSAAKFPF